MRDERGDEVTEEGLPVRGGAVQVPVFQGAAGHCEMRWGAGKVRWMGRRGCFQWIAAWERVGFWASMILM